MPITSLVAVRSTIGLLVIGFLTLFGIVGTTFWLSERAQWYFLTVIDARDTRAAAGELRDALRTAESSQRGYILSGNEIYLAPYDTAKATARRQIDGLTLQLSSKEASQPMLRRLGQVVADKIAEMDVSIALKRNLKDAEALAGIRSNRGKALMDEANVFLSGIILTADELLTTTSDEQRANTMFLRLVSLVGGIVIVLVVGAVAATLWQYSRETMRARDEARRLNATLEDRVARRTDDLERARDRAEVLLSEVNHRVSNSLSLVASLVSLQSRRVGDEAKSALAATQARIYAVSMIHKRLYTSADVREVEMSEYLGGLLDHLQASMRAEGHGATLRHDIEPVSLPIDQSVNLGVIVTEWVTNAFKYAYPDRDGEVRVRFKRAGAERVELVVEDDGVGRDPARAPLGTGVGTRIVSAMASTIKGDIRFLPRDIGTAACLSFPLAPA